MNDYYSLTDFAQYGSGDYGESLYGDNGQSAGGLTDTGIGPLPGIIIGIVLILASVYLLLKRSRKDK